MNRMKDFDENGNEKIAPMGGQEVSDDEIVGKSLQALEQHKAMQQNTRPPIQEKAQAFKAPANGLEMGYGGMPINPAGEYKDANYYEVTGLPSEGKFYPKGTTLMARPLKVIEVKKISSLNEDNADFIVNDILRRTVRGINVEDILLADKLFLIMWLRANTYRDSSYVIDYGCRMCQNKGQFHFELDQLEVQHLDPNYNDTVVLNSGKKLKIKFLTIGDEIKINRFQETNKSVGEIDTELLSIAYMLEDLSEDKKSLMEKYWWLTNMEPQDFAYITSYIEKFGMGIKPFISITCEKCGGITPVGISFRADFFLPSYKFE